MKKGIVYYTDNRCEERIAEVCRRQIRRCVGDIPVVCVSQFPVKGFGENIVVDYPRNSGSIFKQIMRGIEVISTSSLS